MALAMPSWFLSLNLSTPGSERASRFGTSTGLFFHGPFCGMGLTIHTSNWNRSPSHSTSFPRGLPVGRDDLGEGCRASLPPSRPTPPDALKHQCISPGFPKSLITYGDGSHSNNQRIGIHTVGCYTKHNVLLTIPMWQFPKNTPIHLHTRVLTYY